MPHYTTVPIEYSTSSRPSGASRVPYSRGHSREGSGYRNHYEAENGEFSEREEWERRHFHGSRHRQTPSSYSRQSPDSPVSDRYSYEYPPTVPTTAPEAAYIHPEGIPIPAPYPAHTVEAARAPKITVSAYEYEGYEYTYHPQQPDSHIHQQHHHYQKRYPEPDHYSEDPHGQVPQDPYIERHVYPTEPFHYNSGHSYSHQSHSRRNPPQSPLASSHHLRRIPSTMSNHSERYSASPPSPTDSEVSRQVNSYGRVPLWYEERVAFTRYT